MLLSDKSRLQGAVRTILHAVRQIVIGQSAHGCYGSKHSQDPGVADWSDFQEVTSTVALPS